MARRRRRTRRNRAPLPGWVWGLAGLGVGLAIAVLVYQHRGAGPVTATTKGAPARAATSAQPAASGATPSRDEADPSVAEPSPAAAQAAEEAAQYDFYDILPNFEVVIPDRDPTPTRDVPSRAVTEPGRYLLQVGSFSTHKDADQRQATLALLGVEATIQRVTIDDDVFYRVRVGPIEDLDELNRARHRLAEAHIEALLMKAP